MKTERVKEVFALRETRRGPGICRNWIYNNDRGVPVLAHNHYLKELDIAVITEIEIGKAFCPKDEDGNYFFDEYIELYGYDDLFLINPDGYVFFTAAKESNFKTNMVNGKYSNSGLGKLVRNVIETKELGFADYEQYAPSGGEPAAFVAQPIMHDGEVLLIVALQLPLEGINHIMQERTGMGETWALIAEIGQTEVNAPVRSMIMVILMIGVVMAVIVALIALFIGISISNPLVKSAAFTKLVADGDLTQQLHITQKDEVGILVEALNRMVSNLRNMT